MLQVNEQSNHILPISFLLLFPTFPFTFHFLLCFPPLLPVTPLLLHLAAPPPPPAIVHLLQRLLRLLHFLLLPSAPGVAGGEEEQPAPFCSSGLSSLRGTQMVIMELHIN